MKIFTIPCKVVGLVVPSVIICTSLCLVNLTLFADGF